jgi:hypothetical protein
MILPMIGGRSVTSGAKREKCPLPTSRSKMVQLEQELDRQIQETMKLQPENCRTSTKRKLVKRRKGLG